MQVDNAYIAGFIDGEGSVHISERNYWKRDNRPSHRENYGYQCHYFVANIQIKQVNIDVLDFIKAKFGGSTRGPHKAKSKYNARPIYIWNLYLNKNSLGFINAIEPYLKLKKQHFKLIRSLIETVNDDEKRKLMNSIKILNQRGNFVGKQLPL